MEQNAEAGRNCSCVTIDCTHSASLIYHLAVYFEMNKTVLCLLYCSVSKNKLTAPSAQAFSFCKNRSVIIHAVIKADHLSGFTFLACLVKCDKNIMRYLTLVAILLTHYSVPSFFSLFVPCCFSKLIHSWFFWTNNLLIWKINKLTTIQNSAI